jgi:hypothetical protein
MIHDFMLTVRSLLAWQVLLLIVPSVILIYAVLFWEHATRLNQRIDAEHHNRYWSPDTEAHRVELHQRANAIPEQRGRQTS